MSFTDKIVDFLNYVGKGIGSETHTVACQFAAFLDRFEPQAQAEQIIPKPIPEPVVTAPEPEPEPTPEETPEPTPEVPLETTIETPVEGQ